MPDLSRSILISVFKSICFIKKSKLSYNTTSIKHTPKQNPPGGLTLRLNVTSDTDHFKPCRETNHQNEKNNEKERASIIDDP